MSRTLRRAVVCALIFTTLPAGLAQAETADEFVARTNRELAELGLEVNAAGWTQATYINVDTQLINAKANERFFAYVGKAVEDAKQFEGQPMSPASKRALLLLKFIVGAGAGRPGQARGVLQAPGRDGGQVRLGQVLPAGSRVLP